MKVPADLVVLRQGTHPNISSVLVPCDLSPFTLIQIRVALHGFHGWSDVKLRFVHVSQSPEKAREKWAGIVGNFEMPSTTPLKIIQSGKGSNIAETLLQEVKTGEYGTLILGRRGGLARVRRRILGSVSKRLLNELPQCSFAIVG